MNGHFNYGTDYSPKDLVHNNNNNNNNNYYNYY